jgi:hypothetical protein
VLFFSSSIPISIYALPLQEGQMGQAFKKRNATSSIEEAADLLIYRSVG